MLLSQGIRGRVRKRSSAFADPRTTLFDARTPGVFDCRTALVFDGGTCSANVWRPNHPTNAHERAAVNRAPGTFPTPPTSTL